jgi:PAS domain S-box-containing protein
MKALDDKLSALLDAAPDPMIIVDPRGKIVFASSLVEGAFGYVPSELIGSPIEMLIPERLRESHVRHRRDYFDRPVVRRMGSGLELRGRRKDGTEFPVEISLGPFRGNDETFVWSIIRDSTVHELLAQKSAFAESLLRTVPTIIVLLDSNGRILQINSYMERLSGYRQDEVVGKDWFTTFLPEEDRAAIRDLFGRVMHTGVNPGHVNRIVTRDGTLRQVEWHAETLTDGSGRVTLLNVGHDITERIVFEEALRRADEALREADSRKNDFLAMLAHELRNPLNTMSHALELTHVVNIPERILEYRDTMERQVTQLTRLVDDLLDVSRITRGTFQLAPQRIELNEVVRQAVEDVQSLIDRAGHSLSVVVPEEPIVVHADPARMSQVLTNVLSNAAKYTPAGGQIALTVEATPEGVHIRVKDNGIGIPSDKLEAIFEMFEQLRFAPRGGNDGQGIGLGLARLLIEMHGGTIGASSAGLQQGSEFIIWIPTYAETDSPDARSVARPSEPEQSAGEHELI